MKKTIVLFLLLTIAIAFSQHSNKTVITKENGRIYVIYKDFSQFLQSDKSWKTYNSTILQKYPVMGALHKHNLKYGFIDSVQFKAEIADYTLEQFLPWLNKMSDEKVNRLYDSVIKQMDSILTPLDSVDVCLYLPYGRDCFIMDVNGKKTIYISIKWDDDKMGLILTHEYAHSLHHQRRPQEPSTLQQWVVSEGVASYFPILVNNNNSIYDGLWMMPKENINWCIQHEQLILDSLVCDLDKNSLAISKTYIAGGEGFATPPAGFPEKTGYYIGYRMVEMCLQKGVTLRELCGMTSQKIMEKSGIIEKL